MSADFESWSKESLVRFARDANERVLQQKAEIEALRGDLKTALAVYRREVTAAVPPRPPGA